MTDLPDLHPGSEKVVECTGLREDLALASQLS